MTGGGRTSSWLVTCRSVEELAGALAQVEGARFVRALEPGTAVVAAPRAARARLAALPGVERVEEDTLRHLQKGSSG